MGTTKKKKLPESLFPFKHLIDSSNNQSFLLRFHPASELTTLNQIAGNPFVDQCNPIPKDNNGKDMLLLAQIDFGEIPLQQPFPVNGIVQFFVNEDFGKQHFHSQNEHFFVRYIEQSVINEKIQTPYSDTKRLASAPIPYKFSGISKIEPVSSFDYRYETYFNGFNEIIFEDERTFHEIYTICYLGAEHKIGGYPYFIDEDFRSKHSYLQKYDILLLQLVADDEHEIGYRDSGIISFFIEAEKLLNKDFTDVYMHTEHY